ncbi:MAG: HD domain-containing protein [Candidatus Omnitrophota bacterium]|nr:HD domain-containing protein [Candidatus Omnitrophota bacterium]
MIRISDIIKMSGNKQEPKNESKPLVREPQKQSIADIAKCAQNCRIESSNLYNRGVSLIGEALGRVVKDEVITSAPILNFSKNLVEALLIDEDEYFSQFYNSPPASDYLPYHSLNVSFLAIKIGIWSGLNKSELMELAISGFLHDLGMAKVGCIVLKETTLENDERQLVEQHPDYSVQILKKMGCLSEGGLLAVKTHHYRGPRDKFSEILSLADIYEAITHSRLYRKAKAPHQAIGEIIDKEALSFQPSVLKAFVNNIGIYPVGSWVKLSTGEIGLVTGMNKGYPLRPKINIIFNHMGERLTCAKVLDFMSETYFYIEGPLDITDLEKLKLTWEEKNKNTSNLN